MKINRVIVALPHKNTIHRVINQISAAGLWLWQEGRPLRHLQRHRLRRQRPSYHGRKREERAEKKEDTHHFFAKDDRLPPEIDFWKLVVRSHHMGCASTESTVTKTFALPSVGHSRRMPFGRGGLCTAYTRSGPGRWDARTDCLPDHCAAVNGLRRS